MTGFIAGIINSLSVSVHFESLARGVVDSKDLVYFGSIIFLGLFLTEVSMAKRNAYN